MKPRLLLILTVLMLGTAPLAPAQSVSESTPAAAERGVPLGQLLDGVARRSGKKLLVDPRVGVTLPVHLYGQDSSKIDYGELLAILDLYGFTAVEEGGYVHVIPNAEVRQRGIPVVAASENLPLAQYVTVILRVKSVPSVQLVPLLRPMLQQQGHLAALPCRNAMIMVDTLANVRRIKAVIESLDTGEPLPLDKCDMHPPVTPLPPPPPRAEGPPHEPGR